jgi:NADH:ubiquinone oxidoreductase subunit 6 (subunit J)
MFSMLTKKTVVNTVILLPLIFTFFFVYKFGITIPFWDEWELVPLLEKMHNNTLTLADLWNQHNEHRLIFPQILMLLLARLSNWNIFLELCTNMVLATFTLLFLLSILRSTSEIISPWLKIFISLMIFSMVQYENWSWGWQIQFFMSILGSVIAIWAANKWQGKSSGLVIVILAAVLSSYSFNTGLLTWPAVLVVLLLQKKWKRKHIITLTLACIATVLLYYYKYTKPSYHPPILFFLDHPLIYTRYVLTYLGRSLCWTYFPPFTVALIILAMTLLAIFNIWRFDKQKLCNLAPWLALTLYACLAACVTGLGRAGFGWQQAASSRYTTISVLLPLSSGVLLYHSMKLNLTIDKKKLFKNQLFAVTIISIFLISYVSSYNNGIKLMKEKSIRVNASAFCLTHPQIADEYSLKRLYPNPDIIRPRIKTLSDLGIKFRVAE